MAVFTNLEQALSRVVHDRSWLPWAVALGVTAGGTLLLVGVRAIIHHRLSHRAPLARTRFDDMVDDLVQRTSVLFLVAAAALAALAAAELPAHVEHVVRRVATVICLLQAGVWASRAILEAVGRRFATATATATATGDQTGENQALVRMSMLALRLVLWTIVTLVALDNFGVNITALVTGLGVGGVAVALATQNILGDLFASVSILIDKPFVQGDFISIDDYMGTVEQIGVKTTRVRALGGEQIVFANSDLLKSRLRNYKTLRERRVVFKLGVVYETPTDQAAALPALLRAIVERQAGIRFDRAHFVSFDAQALLFEVVYFVLDGDYGRYMDIQQAINLELHRELGARGVALAYPARMVQVRADAPALPAQPPAPKG